MPKRKSTQRRTRIAPDSASADRIAKTMPDDKAIDRLARKAGEGPKPAPHSTSLGFPDRRGQG